MRRSGLGTAIALGVALTLTGCGAGQVRDLAADPVASATPTGGELVSSDEERARGGGLLGKPSPAHVHRTYAFGSGAAAQQAVTELQAEAEEAGWEISSVAPDGSGFSAARFVGDGRATLTVALNLDPAFPPAPGVFVLLSQRGA